MRLMGNNLFYSGVLYGPWAFIYGIAMLIMIIVNKLVKRLKLDKWLEILLFYFLITIVLTLVEFSGGMLIQKIFHVVYWDYTNLKFNFGHYIALEVALGWGFFATLINYLLNPWVEKLAKIIPKFVSVLLIIFFLLDVVITILY